MRQRAYRQYSRVLGVLGPLSTMRGQVNDGLNRVSQVETITLAKGNLMNGKCCLLLA